MKQKFLTKDDVAMLKAAKKVMRKVQRKLDSLNSIRRKLDLVDSKNRTAANGKNMKIYIRVDEDGFGQQFWLYHDEYESYLVDKLEDLDGEIWASAAKSVKEAKRWMKEAKHLMEWDGACGQVNASAWRFVRGKLVETKFTKDNKIKP